MTTLTSIRVQSETASFAQAPARCEPRREARAKKAERVSYESGRALDANLGDKKNPYHLFYLTETRKLK